jgi:hypothetical protein
MRRALLLVAVVAATFAPLARADGDPASDYLLTQQLFAPQGISSSDAEQLLGLLRDAKARGYPIRVAIITRPTDLGAVTALWRKPKLYARFLGQELQIVYHGRLLVVMPNGLGVTQNAKPVAREQAAADRIVPGKSLAAAAARAVVRLAAIHNVNVTPPPLATGKQASGGNTSTIVAVVAVAIVLLLVAAGVVLWRRRVSR